MMSLLGKAFNSYSLFSFSFDLSSIHVCKSAKNDDLWHSGTLDTCIDNMC